VDPFRRLTEQYEHPRQDPPDEPEEGALTEEEIEIIKADERYDDRHGK
jgi:hypothetical protein